MTRYFSPKTVFEGEFLKIISPPLLALVLFVVTVFGIVLPSFQTSIMNQKKEMIRELTYTAWSILASFERSEQAGEISREKAQALAIKHIKEIRYGVGKKDYFWITDMHPSMVMHPYRSDLENQDLSNFSDEKGKLLFVSAVELVKEQGGGYDSYTWQWKDNSERIVPKLSYVKGFEPWGWIIGTGMYLNDVRHQVASITKNLLYISATIVLIVTLLSLYNVRQGLRGAEIRRQAEEELKKYSDGLEHLVDKRTAELHQANDELEAFVYTVSHDLRAPLTAVIGFADVLKDIYRNQLEEQGLDLLDEIEKNGERMAAMIEDLLMLAQVGRLEPPKEPVDVNVVVREVLDEHKEIIHKEQIIVDVPSLPPLAIPTTFLFQIFSNLIGNAIRYGCSPGGCIEVGGEQEGTRVRYFVQDHGHGISPEERTRIFAPFYRGSTTSKKSGNGIGLATVTKICSFHNGRAWVEETAGGGSTFWVELFPAIES